MAKTPKPKPATAAASKTLAFTDQFKDFPNAHILERRLQNPDDPGTQPIYLRDDPRPACAEVQHFLKSGGKARCVVCKLPFRRWYLRWINSQVPNRLHSITFTKGYVKVMKDELADADQISDLAATVDQTVRRGEKGQGVLVKIPFAAYCQIKQAELARRDARDKSAKKVREDLADAIGSSLGDEAGESVSNMVAEFRRPRSTVQEEMGDE